METPGSQLQAETEKILDSLSPNNKAVFDKFQRLEQTRKESGKPIRRYALQQLATDEELTVYPDTPRGKEMWERQTAFDEKSFLLQHTKGKVLDIGSAGKDELEEVAPDRQITYLDIKRFQQKNFVQADASKLPFKDKTFGTIYSSGVINGYQDAKELLPEMLRAIKPDGIIILCPGGSQEILESLLALSELGIDIEKQCELTLAEVTLKHKKLPISIDRSGVYITVRLGQRKGALVSVSQSDEIPSTTPNVQPENNVDSSFESVKDYRVEAYKVFQNRLNPKSDVVYYPSCGPDDSPSRAFPNSRIIYVDIEENYINSMKREGLEAYCQSALDFQPDRDPDILITISPAISVTKLVKHVALGGYVLTNNRHGSADEVHEDADFQAVGVIRKDVSGKPILDTENPEDHWKEVETDDEFKSAPYRPFHATYEEAAEIVKKITGKDTDILAEYKKLLELARKETAEKEKAEHARLKEKFPDLEGYSPSLSRYVLLNLTHEGQTFELPPYIPRKKGGIRDIYVFKRIKK